MKWIQDCYIHYVLIYKLMYIKYTYTIYASYNIKWDVLKKNQSDNLM